MSRICEVHYHDIVSHTDKVIRKIELDYMKPIAVLTNDVKMKANLPHLRVRDINKIVDLQNNRTVYKT